MTTYADDGFGNLRDVKNPYDKKTTVYTRLDGRVAGFEVGTGDHAQAIQAIRESLGDIRLSKSGKWKNGPVLAVI